MPRNDPNQDYPFGAIILAMIVLGGLVAVFLAVVWKVLVWLI